MKTIHYIALLVSLLASCQIFAQNNPLEMNKVALTKNKTTKVNYIRHPEQPLGQNHNTYNIRVVAPPNLSEDMIQHLENAMSISGYERVNTPNADLTLLLTINRFLIETPKVTMVDERNKKGDIIEHNTTVTIPYRLYIQGAVVDNSTNKVIASSNVSKTRDSSFIYSAKDEPNRRRRFPNRDMLLHDAPNMAVDELMNATTGFLLEMSDKWDQLYGTKEVETIVMLLRPKDDKYEETHNMKYELAKLGNLPDLRVVDPKIIDEVGGFIRYNISLKESVQDYKPKAKAKLLAMTNYNLAVIYYWFDDFDTSEFYIKEGLKTGEEKSPLNSLQKEIRKTKELLYKNRKSNRSQY